MSSFGVSFLYTHYLFWASVCLCSANWGPREGQGLAHGFTAPKGHAETHTQAYLTLRPQFSSFTPNYFVLFSVPDPVILCLFSRKLKKIRGSPPNKSWLKKKKLLVVRFLVLTSQTLMKPLLCERCLISSKHDISWNLTESLYLSCVIAIFSLMEAIAGPRG